MGHPEFFALPDFFFSSHMCFGRIFRMSGMVLDWRARLLGPFAGALGFEVQKPESNGSFPRNSGGLRACAACSKPEANLIRVGSLKAVPMKLMPTGRPKELPMGTLMMGYPRWLRASSCRR